MATRRAKRGERAPERDSSDVVLPAVRPSRAWSPSTIRSAEIAADGGNLRSAADLCDWLLTDDRVQGAIGARLNGVFGQPLSFEAAGDRRRRNRAVRALEAGEDWDAMLPEAAASQVVTWAILLGIGTGVLRWAHSAEHDGRDLARLEFFHPSALRYDWVARQWLARSDASGVTERPVTFGDGVWLGHAPSVDYRPWAGGIWRSLAPWVLLKAYAISDWGRASESAARNVVEVDKDIKATRETRSELAEAIRRAGRDGTIVLPSGFRLKLVETSATTHQLYQAQIAAADAAIAIAVHGNNLTTEVSGGSRAAAEVHERVNLANARRDASAWSTTTHDQVLSHWAASNFGDKLLAPWPVYSTEPEEDRASKADVLVKATEGAKQAEALGFELDRQAFIDAFELDFLRPGAPVAPDPPPEPAPTEPDPAPVEDDPDGDPEDDSPDAAAGRAALRDRRAAAAAERNGQDYADRVRERMTAHAARGLAPTVAAMVAAVRTASSYEEARDLIARKYAALASPRELASLTDAALTMAQLGGHLDAQESP